jgi:hypothetical protein
VLPRSPSFILRSSLNRLDPNKSTLSIGVKCASTWAVTSGSARGMSWELKKSHQAKRHYDPER